ncbi:MAG: hypothetical protein K2K02_10450 [Ruminococcus sp.]|nr:hypothetical protein [Ruminococcus sp.]MDE6500892.1 hypothetical protein [Ruminococcus sp.]MDE6679445.1 hypothetical protein [Ruminococcus sp.]
MSVYNNGKFADIPPSDIPPDSADILEKIFGKNLESDKLLVLALMFMLVREGADMKLILALGYILL